MVAVQAGTAYAGPSFSSCHRRAIQFTLRVASGKPNNFLEGSMYFVLASTAAHFNRTRGGSHASEAEPDMYDPLFQSDYLRANSGCLRPKFK